MKNVLTLFIASVLLVSCHSDQYPISQDEISGKWLLTEQLLDPGDGSGKFVSVTSNKTIEFFRDGTYKSNGAICTMSIGSGTPSSGRFNSSKQTLEAGSCGNVQNEFEINYMIVDTELILYYPCFEGCAQKFEKVQ